MSELGPVSQAILEYINGQFGYIEFFRMINKVSLKVGGNGWHTNNWYFRRLVALAHEGHIEMKVTRDGDKLSFRFRRLQDER